jgi:predicted ATP-grasp superfamily ATP-dependent carboligase
LKLRERDIRNVLVIGVDVVSLAASARKAGYRVYAADYFGDQDLKCLCHESRSIVKQTPGGNCGQLSIDFKPEAFLQLTREFLKNNERDAALLSSGLDDSLDVLFELNDMIPILGNHPSVIEKARDKTRFFQELKRLGIPHPETAIVEDFEEAKEKSKDIGYPVLVKPLRSFGGAGIRKAQDSLTMTSDF